MKTSEPHSDPSSFGEMDDESTNRSTAMRFVYAGPKGESSSGDLTACAVENAVPIDQPDQVHQITPALFACYEVDQGSVSLDGCLLEDVPFVRIEFRRVEANQGQDDSAQSMATKVETESSSQQPFDRLLLAASSRDVGVTETKSPGTFNGVEGWVSLNREGIVMEPHRAHALGIDYPTTAEGPPTYVNPVDVQDWLIPLLACVDQNLRDRGFLIEACSVVWCKRAIGRIRIEIGEESATIPFSGWARELGVGQTVPPPFQCSRTGRESYRITAAEDGQLTVPEAIKQCAASGFRVMETELLTCSATGRQCLPEYMGVCEATGKQVWKDQLIRCTGCGQHVSPKAMSGARCETCRQLGSQPAATSEIEKLFQRFPGLRKWKGWQHSRSDSSELWRGYAWLKSITLRLDRESSRPRSVFIANRMGKNLQEIAPRDWRDWLGGDVESTGDVSPRP